MNGRHWLKRAPLVPLAGAGLVLGQIAYVARRRDLPSFPNQDPSGLWGQGNAFPLRLAVLGDSTVTGPGVDDVDDMWVRRVAHSLASHWRVEVHSIALGGSKARHVLHEQVPKAIELQPHVALVSVGANDAIRATPLSRFAGEMAEICDRLREQIHSVVVIGVGDMGTIPRLPSPLRWAASARSKKVNETIRDVADGRENVYYVDSWKTMSEFQTRDPELFSPDLFHASGQGHAIFYNGAMPTILEAVAGLEGLEPLPG